MAATMIFDTEWKNQPCLASLNEKLTLFFSSDGTFQYTQKKQEQAGLIVQHFEGSWKLQTGSDIHDDKGRLCLTVTYISAKDSGNVESFERYRYDLREYMNQQHREQGKIAKAVNAQQRELECREMNLGRPGYDNYLLALEEQHKFEQNKWKRELDERRQAHENIKVCQCPRVTQMFGVRKENPMWWCVQCRTTECELCTKTTCYRGLDSDHETKQNDTRNEEETLRQEMLMMSKCRDVGIRPEYYEIDFVDFVAQWRIMKSSTVVRQFR
jgi:hypothetical protein